MVVTSSSDAKLERALALGASVGINYKSTPNWGSRVAELEGGVNRVIEVGGAGTLKESLDAVAFGGHVLVIGVLSGAASELSITTVLHKCIQIRGVYCGSVEMFHAMRTAPLRQTTFVPSSTKCSHWRTLRERLSLWSQRGTLAKS